MRSHTGAVLSLGQGALMSMSLKQKNNTKRSTKVELVGVNDAMNFVEWIQLFVDQQLKSINNGLVL
jgi:predicted ATPase